MQRKEIIKKLNEAVDGINKKLESSERLRKALKDGDGIIVISELYLEYDSLKKLVKYLEKEYIDMTEKEMIDVNYLAYAIAFFLINIDAENIFKDEDVFYMKLGKKNEELANWLRLHPMSNISYKIMSTYINI